MDELSLFRRRELRLVLAIRRVLRRAMRDILHHVHMVLLNVLGHCEGDIFKSWEEGCKRRKEKSERLARHENLDACAIILYACATVHALSVARDAKPWAPTT